MRGILEKVKNGVLDVVFPAVCVGCGKEGSYICMRCEGFVSEAALICPQCQQSSLTGERHATCGSRFGLDGLVSCWEYEGLVKSLLHQIKYNGVTHAAKEITKRLVETMARDQSRFGAFLSFFLSSHTFITYVPMFGKKERQRGFNQAKVLAKELAKIAGKETLSALEKIHDTKPQVELTKEERLRNIKDAFGLKSEIRSTKSETPNQNKFGTGQANSNFQIPKSIVLVDDVWTTGATMKECCKVLKSAGVQQVWGFTVARTP